MAVNNNCIWIIQTFQEILQWGEFGLIMITSYNPVLRREIVGLHSSQLSPPRPAGSMIENWQYSRARLIRMANAPKKIMRLIWGCKLSEPILHYVLMNGRELCAEQAYKLSWACELARVKLSGLYCTCGQSNADCRSSPCWLSIPLPLPLPPPPPPDWHRWLPLHTKRWSPFHMDCKMLIINNLPLGLT